MAAMIASIEKTEVAAYKRTVIVLHPDEWKECPKFFKKIRKAAEEEGLVNETTGTITPDFIVHGSRTDFEEALSTLPFIFELQFKDGFVCKMQFV